MQVLLAAAGEPWETDLVRWLQRPGSSLTLVRRCMDVPDAVATAASGQADVVLFGPGLPGLDTDAIARVRDAGAAPVGLVGSESGAAAKDAAGSAHLQRLGVSCVLAWTALDELPAALAAADAAARQGLDGAYAFDGTTSRVGNGFRADGLGVSGGGFGVEGAATPVGRLLAVWGPTGAPGRSTVALGLAAELAGRRVPTLLVDADVYGGAIAQMLAVLDEVSGLLAAARLANTGSLDLAALHGQIREVNPYLRVLTGLPRADRWPQLRPAALSQVLHVARQMAPTVVVDCGFCLEQDEELSFDTAAPRRNGATLLILEQADQVVAVGAADPLGLSRLARGVLDLQEAVPGTELSIAVNRVRSGLGWTHDEIGETVHRFTGLAPVAYLPEDRAAVDKAWVEGRSLLECVPDAPLRRALAELAVEVGRLPAARRRRGRRRVR
jgi:MinD-like ATPase involved in chromosome partitioning or flagellar assembly